ncbi:MAG TPA: NADH-quinone oxidoreductase subunit M [Armatimonadaceae bacterium]|nr:NADH-quinone oxidoreductase subunit M [Armatimonadaceae bacterium]
MQSILTILLLIPVVGAVLIGLLPRGMARTLALLTAVVTFLASLALFGYAPLALDASAVTPAQAAGQFQFQENVPWFSAFGISYHLGVDGPAMLLIVMTTFLQIFAVLCSWDAIKERVKEYYILLTLLETAMIGSFCALDLILFYVFFEACLVPMYFLIGIWGGKRRIYAAVKFFLYTLAGSLLMLVAILALYLNVRGVVGGAGTFDYLTIKSVLAANPLPLQMSLLMFGAFSLAFAIKVPMFPFHTWLPDAHVEAPTAGSVILAGVLLKLGTYGFMRFAIPLFPEAAQLCAPFIVTLAVIGIIYGALVAAMQRDVKKLVAYSSVSHLGFVMLGLFSFDSKGMTGAVLQMINHGISTGALFLMVGMIYERRHTRQIKDFGGLWEQMPLYSRIFLIVTFSSIALPLTNGFVGEFLILVGSFQTFPLATVFATSGVILSAIYMLWMYQRVFYGTVDKPENRALRDINNPLELASVVPLVILIFWLGIYPSTFTRYMDHSIDLILRDARGVERVRYENVTESARTAAPRAAAAEPVPVKAASVR